MEDCQYKPICKFYDDKKCIDEKYQGTCWIYRTFEGIMDKQVFRSRIWKRIMREEHGHGWEIE